MLSLSVFRDAVRKLSLRKKLTILASVGVLLPLLALSYLQYQSLVELQDKTKGAFKDNLRQGFTIVEQRMKQRLEDLAAQTLSPIDNLHVPYGPTSSPDPASDLAKHFANVKSSHPEIEDIFVFNYPGELLKTTPANAGILFLFDRSRMSGNYLDTNRNYLFAHAAQGTFLFHPFKDSKETHYIFAGVLLNEAFVRNDLIARTIAETAGHAHAANPSLAIAITITDENNQVLFTTGPPQHGYFFESNFDRPFATWKGGVGLKNTNLDDLARDSFLHSAGASVLVLLVLLVGIALTIRATDREARLAQAKANFVSNVSHELKTPLSLLSLFSEILELGRVKSEDKKLEYYRIIRHESLRLNKMIDNILDFSKIEAGRKTYNFAVGDLTEVIESVLSSYRYQIATAGFDVQTNLQPKLPPVSIDREAMAQAISNLLDNAIKYSGDTKQISLTAKTLGSNLSIEIADRGIGIPHAEQARIFEKFYRVGNGLVHDVKGSGLGLSLVKHIIEAHSGTISVESEVDNGSRFTILLPQATRAANVQNSHGRNEVG
jgi:signal transduction histidine kinase